MARKADAALSSELGSQPGGAHAELSRGARAKGDCFSCRKDGDRLNPLSLILAAPPSASGSTPGVRPILGFHVQREHSPAHKVPSTQGERRPWEGPVRDRSHRLPTTV